MHDLWTAYQAAPSAGVVFLHQGRPITWADVRGSVDAIADRIAATGGPLFLHTRSAAAFLAGLLAALKLRRPLVCPGYAGPAYLEEIRAHEGVFITDAEQPDGVSLVAKAIVDDSAGLPSIAEPVDADALPITFMTSGTTSQPKAVAKTLRELERESANFESLWGRSDGHVVATVSHQHIYGMLFRVLWPVIAGRPSDALQTEFWEQLNGRLNRHSVLVSSPAHLSRLPGASTSSLGCPSLIFSSGGPLSFADAKTCETRFGQLPVEVFGSTETGGIAWRRQHEEGESWTPFPDVTIGTDPEGLLSVRSPWTGRADPVITGDRVIVTAKGAFRFQGRADTIVKIEGKRVSLTRVEQALRDLPQVDDASATVIDLRPQILAAAVVLDVDGRRDLERLGSFAFSRSLRRQLGSRLEPLERPKIWRFVDLIPTNGVGKRTQAGIRALFTAAPSPDFETASVRAQSPSDAEVEFELDESWIWFDGHFPDQPIFPGVAEVHLAVVWSARIWDGWRPTTSHVTRLKFSRVLRPGERVRLKLTRDIEKNTLRFRYIWNEEVAGEGVIGGKP